MAFSITIDAEVKRVFNITSVIRQLEGGQKYVFVVEADGKQAVLKIMKAEVSRLPREMNVYDNFKGHSGIATLIRKEVVNKKHVILEEYIEGRELNDILHLYKNDVEKVRFVIRNLINTLIPIWNKDIVHRDIKPSNIIIRPDGTPVLLDFGIAKDFSAKSVTDTGFQPLTPLYGAPEQYRGDKDAISFKTDAFSIGILAYQLFYGKLPFGDSEDDIKRRFAENSTPLIIPQDCPIHDFLESCLGLSPADRPRLSKKLLEIL